MLRGACWDQVLLTRETASLDLSQLVSDIGGQLGIWIGLSFVAVVELLELAWRVANTAFVVRLRAFRRRRRRRCLSVSESASAADAAADGPAPVDI